MKWWVYIASLLCFGRICEGGVLKCAPGSQDPSCLSLNQDIDAPVGLLEKRTEAGLEVECLAGSEWESNCHFCHCSESGVAECTRQETCKSPYADPVRCKANTTFQRDCSTCVCLENGLGLCTLTSCRKNVQNTERPPGKQCAVGSSWKSLCNDCVCSPDGYPFCTEKACPNQEKELPLTCAPGSFWKDDCNNCWCDLHGAACTRMGCPKLEPSLQEKEVTDPKSLESKTTNVTKSIVCQANRMFIKDCNTCWCNEDGTGYFCTRKVCINELPEEDNKSEELRIIMKDCRPDEVFELDCNMCRCNPDGKSFSCTRRACAEQIDELEKKETLSRRIRKSPQTDPPKACQPGQEFRMDCNKCLCDNKGENFSCTRIDCNSNNGGAARIRKKREASQEITMDCTPTSVFEKDCNVCRCTSDGRHAMCTLNRCNKPKDSEIKASTESDPGFRCNPGEQFKRECNDCTCSADGKSVFCTLRFCEKDLTEI